MTATLIRNLRDINALSHDIAMALRESRNLYVMANFVEILNHLMVAGAQIDRSRAVLDGRRDSALRCERRGEACDRILTVTWTHLSKIYDLWNSGQYESDAEMLTHLIDIFTEDPELTDDEFIHLVIGIALSYFGVDHEVGHRLIEQLKMFKENELEYLSESQCNRHFPSTSPMRKR
jgi:hypothetical protein